MSRLASLLVVAFAVAGCGGSTDHAAIQLKVTVTSAKTTLTFGLDCEPTSGTLRLAPRICADIAGHRQSTPLAIYYAAGTRDGRLLRLMQPRLRCEDDPALLERPTPWASVAACTHGMWTPRAERAIRLAKRSLAISGVAAASAIAGRSRARGSSARAARCPRRSGREPDQPVVLTARWCSSNCPCA